MCTLYVLRYAKRHISGPTSNSEKIKPVVLAIVLHIRDHVGLAFSGQNITQKPASQYNPGALAVLVGYNQERVESYGQGSM